MPKCQTLAKPKIVSVTKKNKNIVTKIVFICHIFLTCPVETGGVVVWNQIVGRKLLYIWVKDPQLLDSTRKEKRCVSKDVYFFALFWFFKKKHKGISWSLSCRNSISNWNLRSNMCSSSILAHFFSVLFSITALMKKRVIIPHPVKLRCKGKFSS